MTLNFKGSKQNALLEKIFNSLKDPRRKIRGNFRHKLNDIILLVISAVVCGARDWDDIELFGKEQLTWLKKYGDFTHGVPSHDTINRVISALDPAQFSDCFTRWINEISEISSADIVAIDGKRIRRSYDKYSNKAAIHIVSAFATANKLCLGQVATDHKSNEITAIPELLDVLALKGCTVSIDAMGCQTSIAEKIITKEANYILAVKSNQGKLLEGIKETISLEEPIDVDQNEDVCHGRIESRKCSVYKVSDLIENAKKWKNLQSIILIETERTEKLTGITTTQERYYISSKLDSAKSFNKDIRSHWAIENNLHWILDVTFNEDMSRKRQKNAAINFNIISKIALSLLSKETTLKASKKNKMFSAALNPEYRAKLLNL